MVVFWLFLLCFFGDLTIGLPHTKIVTEQIVFPIKTASGKFLLDLSSYDIKVSDDFFISLELVENFGQKINEEFYFQPVFLAAHL